MLIQWVFTEDDDNNKCSSIVMLTEYDDSIAHSYGEMFTGREPQRAVHSLLKRGCFHVHICRVIAGEDESHRGSSVSVLAVLHTVKD